jgi:hypothetical protein
MVRWHQIIRMNQQWGYMGSRGADNGTESGACTEECEFEKRRVVATPAVAGARGFQLMDSRGVGAVRLCLFPYVSCSTELYVAVWTN